MPVRWKTTSRSTREAISGMNCTALAPVPITATRLPVRSYEWSHCAEWNACPANSPGSCGVCARCSCPVATISASASHERPSVAEIVHDPSHAQRETSTSGTTSRSTSCSRATRRRYPMISSRSGHSRGQSRRCANEKLYRWLGTSHAAPG